MGNQYYDPGGNRAAKVNQLFARIAGRYDLINDLQSFGLHRYWKRRVMQLASARPGARALDVCCGTGDLALALGRRGVEVVGLDFSRPMLEVAQRRSAQAQSASAPTRTGRPAFRAPRFVQGDAQQLPFPDESFEVVTAAYGLRNLACWEAGLAEMQRVAQPGGRVVLLDFGKPDNRWWRGVYFGYLRVCVPWLGRVFCGDAKAYAYILESLRHYPAQRGVASRMLDLGLRKVRIINLMGGAMGINYGEKWRGAA